MQPNSEGFLPCPRCQGTKVGWTNSRDICVLHQEVYCPDCELSTFAVETLAFENLPNLDYETSVMKYNAWVLTKPVGYYGAAGNEWEC
jgi:hypothetical protein